MACPIVSGEASQVLFLGFFDFLRVKRTGFCSYLFLRGLGVCLRGILGSLRIGRCGCFLIGWLLIVRVRSGGRLMR